MENHLQKPKDNKGQSSGSEKKTSENKSQKSSQSGKQQSTKSHASKKRITNLLTIKETELKEMQVAELNYVAKRLGIIGASLLTKDNLVKSILEAQKHPKEELCVSGTLERLPDGFGFLRFGQYDYVSGPDDVYVSPSLIRRFNLRTGDQVYGCIRKPKEGEKYFALQTVEKVNNEELDKTSSRMNFDRLTPLHPDDRFNLETNPTYVSTRIMNVFTPIGKGQRGLIVAPPKVGKTMLLKEIALSLLKSQKDVHMIVLLVDERPEEVSDMKRTIKGENVEIVSSTFDEAAERHVQVAEIVLEKAKRLVEYGKDVVILLDSITRLARAYNTTAPTSGKVLTGGIDAHALQRPKRFFGAARKTEEAGSLTIIATAMVETGSRMDEVIYEEFKGTGNMELHLTRKLSNRRTFPAFDILSSSTRRDDLLLTEEEANQAWILHKLLSTMNVVEGMEFLINKMKKHKTNEEFFESVKKGANGSSSD
ncbi:MAG: transcription termination factor Rho [Epsilonproteobacteria bacterium]|nr:transcription termination factor Rho [Campylobacterota bacterium]|tara:strand:- start:1694 stop:3133 length:1440 start_codon:yes stop_codon:yes gene_type:complete